LSQPYAGISSQRSTRSPIEGARGGGLLGCDGRRGLLWREGATGWSCLLGASGRLTFSCTPSNSFPFLRIPPSGCDGSMVVLSDGLRRSRLALSSISRSIWLLLGISGDNRGISSSGKKWTYLLILEPECLGTLSELATEAA
jgi:hypothetical protein